MEVGNIAKAATFKSFLHVSYKKAQLLFCDSVTYEKNNQWFLGVTQKYELPVSFNVSKCHHVLKRLSLAGN